MSEPSSHDNEDRWIKRWADDDLYTAKPDLNKKKFFLTVAYPYPSGSMHVGHGRTYTVPDVIARFKRMQGFNVLFPMAWHVTGSPVLGIAERIKSQDPETLRIYGELYGVPKDKLELFTDPLNIVKYFSREYKQNMIRLGYSIDWSREFLTITPQYSSFITWQYQRLREKNLIEMGEHPVRYCPRCDNPVGDHDLLEGENAKINEFTVIKFRFNDIILPAATLRAETVYGVTNMWLNPDISYMRVKVADETWLLSREAADKIKQCKPDIEILGEVSGAELIGKDCVNPATDEVVPILPAGFVDPDYATGVVMSVPAHAPYDYIALRDLESKLKPKTIIMLEDMKVPAKIIAEELKITDQSDNKLEQATEILYRREHAKGVMAESIPEYGGLKVDEARKKITEYLLSSGDGDLFYEFSESPVVCRCGTECVIRVLKDQWFLSYGDESWKNKTRECLKAMSIIPDETRANFMYFIGWLMNWACTRRVGLGTRLPWDDNWIIEPLSDSTIYMAYYTIASHLNKIDASKLSTGFFDYVFLGEGDKKLVASSAGLSIDELDGIRDEFMYWYPLDWRLSAKDLVGNHLSFYLFHHTALFPADRWPQGIVVFGMGLLEGVKMSSSKGNIILLEEAVKEYGADVVRLFLMGCAEPWQDFDWRSDLVENTRKKLIQFIELVGLCLMCEGGFADRNIDRWLVSRLNESVAETVNALDGFETRKALQHAFYEFIKHVNWYLRRCEPDANTLKQVADVWIRLMAPFTPYTCEMLWERMGGENLVSNAAYPSVDEGDIDEMVLAGEDLVKVLLDDVRSILEVTKSKPIVFSLEREYEVYSEAGVFFENVFGCPLVLYRTPDYDPKGKARYARPMRPGIYVE